MRAIVLMFDSLNRHMIPPYMEGIIEAPNFLRLASKTLTFSNFYAGSLPCMPARREMHTGRYNFLHRNWGPLEPFDDSMPEILDRNGVHTHLTSDHLHYWEDGGSTYHTRYTTWEFFRGQQGDPWKGVVANGANLNYQQKRKSQDQVNRNYMATEDLHSQTRTVDSGIHFLETNKNADQWMLQIELFDPHEPFFTYQNYLEKYPFKSGENDPGFDYPPYGKMAESESQLESAQRHYKALVSQCDKSVGRVLDFMDHHDMWKDTVLLVNTDHGFLLGEHGYWAKTIMPWYDELVHLPFFMWNPRLGLAGETTDVLAQTIDIAPTLLKAFDIEPTNDMQGSDLTDVVANQKTAKPAALFGVHSGHVNVTDGRYVYMRACVSPDNKPLLEFTLMPSHMTMPFNNKELSSWQPAEPFTFTKGMRTMQVEALGYDWFNPWRYGTLLFDLQNDPNQEQPLLDDDLELRMAKMLVELMRSTDAPNSQFDRLGLPVQGEVTLEHLLCAKQHTNAVESAQKMPPIDAIPQELQQPFAIIVNDPVIRPILMEHAPQAINGEFVQAPGNFNLVGVARNAMLPSQKLQAIIDEFKKATEKD